MFLKRIFGTLPENGLPYNWNIALLDYLAERGSGHTPNKKKPKYWNGGIKWVSLTDSNTLFLYKLTKIQLFHSNRACFNS
jgi:hypothetical protein